MEFKITENMVGIRLDKILTVLTDLSRTVSSNLIRNGKVFINGKLEKASYKVQLGDLINFDRPKAEVLDIAAEDIPLDIIYEDEDVAVVNKPQGMVVHPSAGHPSGTLVNALMKSIKDLSTINGIIRPGIVHRIDKDTSGLLMVAKNDRAHELLAAQLKAKTSTRRYLSIVHGNFSNDRGTIHAPIGRNSKNRKKQAVIANGKKATTHFEVMERFLDYSLITAQLETGRTHQIRVHLAYINHPVAGDPLYAPTKTIVPNAGQFLHAETLGFIHPRTNEFLEFRVNPPKLFQQQLEKLRKEN